MKTVCKLVNTYPAPYFGVAEFTIYAPVGTTFEQILTCDQMVTTCMGTTPTASDTPPAKVTLDFEDYLDGSTPI